MKKVFLLVVLAGLVATMLAAPATAGSSNHCAGVQGEAETRFDPEILGFTGEGEFKVGPQLVTVVATAFAPPFDPADPALSPYEPRSNGWLVPPELEPGSGPAPGSHTLEFNFDADPMTVRTADEVILEPTDTLGLFKLRSRLTVVTGGSGSLHLQPSSTIDLATFTANWEIRGSVCFDD